MRDSGGDLRSLVDPDGLRNSPEVPRDIKVLCGWPLECPFDLPQLASCIHPIDRNGLLGRRSSAAAFISNIAMYGGLGGSTNVLTTVRCHDVDSRRRPRAASS